MGTVRMGGPSDGEHCPLYMDLHGTHQRRIISAGVGDQGGTVAAGTCGSEGVSGEVVLAAFYTIPATPYGRHTRYIGNTREREDTPPRAGLACGAGKNSQLASEQIPPKVPILPQRPLVFSRLPDAHLALKTVLWALLKPKKEGFHWSINHNGELVTRAGARLALKTGMSRERFR